VKSLLVLAHGIVVREDVPIPLWLFAWGAALVLIVSFAALASLWPDPKLQEEGWRPLRGRLWRIVASAPVAVGCGAIGVFLLGLVVYAGLNGTASTSGNFTPTFVFIVFWLLPLPLSVAFGDVFRAFNPWRAVGQAIAFVAGRAAGTSLPAPLEYPRWLGRWPAVLGILAFVWLEIAAPGGDSPDSIAAATLIYSTLTFVGMALYGVDTWIERAEAFSVYFNLVSRISLFERRGRAIGLRRPLSGLPAWDPLPGSVAFVCALIGTVSFDGFSAGPFWNDNLVTSVRDFFEALGLSAARALELSFGLGMIVAVLITFGIYRLGVAGAHAVAGGPSGRELARTFAHSLGPIALVYAAAHYVSFLLLQGQAIVPLLSDPLGRGSDLIGTADFSVDYALIGASTFWYLQLAFVLIGHVAALVLAHDRAVAIYREPRKARDSQIWMLAVMIGFTSLALWLLSEASAG